MFEIEGVKLHFTEEALKAIAKKAMDAGTEARALRMILENLMREIMFEVSSDDSISEIIMDEASILSGKPTQIKRNNKKI